jgi:tetratricopeptide (TPR) repeat protein
VVDAHVYDSWAARMAQGVWLWDRVGNYLPIYPAFLALQKILFGSSPLVNKILQCLMGSLSAVLMADAAARTWNRRVGLTAGYLLAAYWMLVVFDAEKFAESFSIFFQSLTLWLLIRRSRSLWAVAAAGFAFALSAGVRANLFLVLPFVVGWLAWDGRGLRRAAIARALVFVVGTVVIIGPIVYRNYRISGVPMLREQATWSLYAGLAPRFEGLHPPTGILFDKYMHMPHRIGLTTEVEIERYWGRQLAALLRDNPIGVAGNLLRRLVIFCNAREWSQEFDVYAYRGYSAFLSLPWVGFWLVGPLGLLGFVVLRRPNRQQWLIAGYTLIGFLSIIAFKGSDRYRLPTAVLLTLFAAAALWHLVDLFHRVRRGERRAPAIQLLVLVLLCLLCWPDWPHLCERKTARHAFYVGLFNESRDRPDEALLNYLDSMQTFAWDPDSPYRIGRILRRRGDTIGALPYLEEALKREPEFPEALNELARIYIDAGLTDAAEESLQTSLSYNPVEKDTLLLLAELRRRQGRVDEEIAFLEKAAYEARNSTATMILAERLTDLGRYREAVDCYRRVAAANNVRVPDRVQAAMLAGYTAARYLKDRAEAETHWRTVAERYGDYRFFALQARFLIGDLATTDFLQQMNRDRLWQASAAYDVALKLWMNGRTEESVRALEKCLDHYAGAGVDPEGVPLKWAREDLARIKRSDPPSQ